MLITQHQKTTDQRGPQNLCPGTWKHICIVIALCRSQRARYQEWHPDETARKTPRDFSSSEPCRVFAMGARSVRGIWTRDCRQGRGRVACAPRRRRTGNPRLPTSLPERGLATALRYGEIT